MNAASSNEMANFNFPEKRSLKLKEVMGYDKHRIVDGPVCVSDLAAFGLEYLFANRLLDRDGFDALIVVTQSPDYIMPPTSNVIQGRLGLKQDLLCMDINQGCAGFLIGLMQGFLLLDQTSVQRVVLVNADVLSRKVSPRDRNSYPLIGDGASITILERSDDTTPIYMNLKMDGSAAGCITDSCRWHASTLKSGDGVDGRGRGWESAVSGQSCDGRIGRFQFCPG